MERMRSAVSTICALILARRRLLSAALAACALACALPARALASETQESILEDDNQLLYTSPRQAVAHLEQLKALGVDRVKVSVVWSLLAPHADSTHRPNIDATNPAVYPQATWNHYDLIVRTAAALGMKVYFIFVPPVPDWALQYPRINQGPPLGKIPKLSEFRQFVEAVGRRYSGTYPDPDPPTVTPPSQGAGLTILGVTVPLSSGASQSQSQPSQSRTATLPKVDYWGLWNEPNERSWLNPWYRKIHGQTVMLQPSEYRGLVDAAWSGLQASGHAGDTILLGETANRGIWYPLPFIRATYCLGANYHSLKGGAAIAVNCPAAGNGAAFAAAHPALFEAAGWAHHPYGFDVAPNRPYTPDRQFVTLDNVDDLENMLNRIYAAFDRLPPGGVPLFLTEWGYRTNPPNPYSRTTQAEQSTWLDLGDYMTWREPYIHALGQFLLVDDQPKPGVPKGSALYWSTFQTGLIDLHGKPKPSYDTWRVPIWLPQPRHGSNVTIWGELRPADHTTVQYAVLELRRRGSKSWRQLTELSTESAEGFIYTHATIPAAGQVRLAWLDPAGGAVDYSRPVAVR
jgi:hypothetical protein